ncbi:Clathrin heavy chain 2 [Platysternon megacephalum]|uniref:Clathrin heavy chain 2 n=1 Tax=Platysternon megacephalum TaxID=55544 RepID=A0A4D9DTZ1_9SAUR|nr:Clathrin heavy chain 2 [Platysternon megacephalum]
MRAGPRLDPAESMLMVSQGAEAAGIGGASCSAEVAAWRGGGVSPITCNGWEQGHLSPQQGVRAPHEHSNMLAPRPHLAEPGLGPALLWRVLRGKSSRKSL